MSAEQIQTLAALPLQVLLLIAIAALWRAYNTAQNARVDDLKQNYERNLADLRTRVMMVEDRLGIKPLLMAASSKPDEL